ncbi:Small subunit (SSU) processome component [Lithohypha guttulata]|nr:Small subunit (SSU) processome component [Lithohypha guttulata]
MGKKSSATAITKISSTSTLTTPPTSTTSGKSSLLKSSFAPSYLQLHLFASILQSFESQQLRIHDTSNGRLRQQHSVSAGTTVTCLDWGCYGTGYREQRASSKKKRKRTHEQKDVAVAYGTSKSEVCMLSLSTGDVVGTLRGGHERGIRDFRFVPEDNLQAWSIGEDSKLVQWNLQNDKAIRSISLSDVSIQTLSSPTQTPPQILCASGTPYAITTDSEDGSSTEAFDAFKSSIHTLIRSNMHAKDSQGMFLASDQNRYINVYDLKSKKIVRTLVAGGDIECAEIHHPTASEDQMLAVVTRDGLVEIFTRPFSLPQPVDGGIKTKRKALTRKADAVVKLISSETDRKQVPAFTACFNGPNLVVASMEAGAVPVFQKVRWQDEGSGELLFTGVREVVRPRSVSALNTASVNGTKDTSQTQVNDSRTVVVNGSAEPGSQIAPVEIESSDEEEIDNENEDIDEKADIDSAAESDGDTDADMEDVRSEPEDPMSNNGEESAEPSFGDLLAARNPEAIMITDALQVNDKALARVPESKTLMLPSGMSLGTVLAQSLRTNDQSLLETCLHVTDEMIIQNTILRLDSSLAATLLTKLAERLASRPGRYGHLLTWVQSTMIAHGGAIASQAGVASKLRTLYQVLNERSQVLPSILLLKGKLDMMSAQQSFRAQAEAHRKGIEQGPAAIYVEGQTDNWSSDEDLDEDAPVSRQKSKSARSTKHLQDLTGGPESSDDEDMPLTNGHFEDSDEQTEDSDADEPQRKHLNGIIDNEAVLSGESGSEDDEKTGTEDSEDEDDEEEEEDDEEEDSSMVDFINDGEISQEEENTLLDDEPERPLKKKSKHR